MPSARPTFTDPSRAEPSEAPRGTGRWLAFLPCVLIFLLAAAQAAPGHGDERLYFHDELLAAGFISGFLALLWVASKRASTRKIRPPHAAVRGFEVLPTAADKTRRIL